MRLSSRLAGTADFAVDDLRIRERAAAWSEPEPAPAHRVVFVRNGLFAVRLGGWTAVVDPVTAFVARPGEEQSIAHRPGQEDACTVLTLDGRLADELLPATAIRAALRTSGAVDFAHRVLLSRARAGADGFELSERVVRLVGELLREAGGGGVRAPRAPVPSRRRLADAAREALVHDPAVSGVGLLAERLGVSRSHLSRVFRQETGETLTCFRNRVRVRVALDRLAAGAPDLAGLAAELGFADHAHLSRAVRAEVGVPPRHVRDLLRVDHGPDEPRARMFKPAPHTRTTLEA